MSSAEYLDRALPAPTELSIPIEMYTEMIGWFRKGQPNEGCGLLAIRGDAGRQAMAVKFYPGVNIDESPHRFTMDPGEVIAAFREMRERGWRMGAIAHSHPTSSARPSDTDLAEAYYPNAAMVIVAMGGKQVDCRLWTIRAETDPPRFEEGVLRIRVDGG